MQASRINLYYFRKRILSLRLLIVVLALKTVFTITECATQPIQIRGEVGGNGTFYCTKDMNKSMQYMYLQKAGTFVNGFHSSRNITVQMWQNTRVDHKAAAVHMYNLNVSHEGDYECHIEFVGSTDIQTVPLSLRLTASYSKPTISKDCNDESHSCLVQCQSHSGYPSAKMTWNILGDGSNSGQMWRSVNSSEVRSQITLLFNTSGTAVFNCSSGELNISCSVNGSTSDVFTVCAARDPPHSIYMVIAACCVVGVVLVSAFVLTLYCNNKKRQSRTSAKENMMKELPNNNEEGTALTVTSSAS